MADHGAGLGDDLSAEQARPDPLPQNQRVSIALPAGALFLHWGIGRGGKFDVAAAGARYVR